MAHEIGKIPEIVNRIESRRQHLFDLKEMMQIGPRVARANRTATSRIDGLFVPDIPRLLDHHSPETCKERTGPPMARRHHTIEQVDPPHCAFDEIFRHPYTHQIPRLRSRQLRDGHIQHGMHFYLRLSHRKPTDRITLETKPDKVSRRGYAEIHIEAALHDPKEGLIRATPTGLTTLCPESGPSHGIAHHLSLSRQSHAVIERHHNIGPQRFLNFDGGLRCNEMCGPIEMRLKAHALVRHLTQFSQTENLKSAAVRQDGSGPPGEPM